MPDSSLLLTLIGPSASGKSTLARALADQGLATLVPTWTTRPPRPDEEGDTAEHRFVSEEVFDQLSAQQAFLVEGSHPGLPYRYGLPQLEDVRGISMVILRASHVALLASATGQVPVAYQVCAPAHSVAARLAQRGTGEAERRLRLGAYHAERVAGTRISRRTFVNDGPMTTLVAAVSRALTIDFECGGTDV
jgi:guanylate kinase